MADIDPPVSLPQPGASPGTPPVPEDATSEPSLEDLLKDIPEYAPLPKWDEPELRYMPTTADDGQPSVTPDEAWRKINKLVEKYDKGLCESYREQIDTLLVFAGLFSAVVTAFAVESYQWLQTDPNETSAELLQQAVSLLSLLANQTTPRIPQPNPSLPESVIVRINVYWFLSLVLSLSAALVAILCKQWLREYERDVSQSPQQSLGVRQMKFEGLEYWRVGGIVTSVPLLLQIALALFLIGISEFLWHLHPTVALAVTTAAGLTAGFYVITASVPLCQYLYLSICSRVEIHSSLSRTLPGRAFTSPQCPYKSPQAWLALRLCQPVIDWIVFHSWLKYRPDSWVSFDTYWTIRRDAVEGTATTAFRALIWTAQTLEETYLNAWRLLCARQQLVQRSANVLRLKDADKATSSLLNPLLKGLSQTESRSMTRERVALFAYSCNPDLDVNTAVELLLQCATYKPTIEGSFVASCLETIELAFRMARPKLNDELAVELLRFVHGKLLSRHTDAHKAAVVRPMLQPTAKLLAWAHSPATLLPALCAVAVRVLQASPSAPQDTSRAGEAGRLLLEVRRCFVYRFISLDGTAPLRGFGHIAALARFMLDDDPKCIEEWATRSMLDGLGLKHLYYRADMHFEDPPFFFLRLRDASDDIDPEAGPASHTPAAADPEIDLEMQVMGDPKELDTATSGV